MRRLQVQWLWLLTAFACGSGDLPGPGGQTGEESWGCLSVSEQTVPLTETTRLGFAAQDIVAFAQREHTGSLIYSNDTNTVLTVDVTITGSVASVRDREWIAPQDGREVALADCNDDVALDAVLSFVTGDGAFNETLTATLHAETPDAAHAYAERDLTELEGSYAVTELDPADRRVRLFWSFTFNDNGLAGSIDGQAEDKPGDAPNGTVSAQGFDVGTFEKE